jgi:hypothetical protein
MHRIGVNIIIAVIVLSACVAASDAAEIGFWNFDENNCSAPDYSASDSSGNGLNGVIVGSANCVPGISGSALSFVGNGEYIEVPANSILSPPSSLILEASIKLQGFALYSIMSRQDTAGNGYSLMVSPNMVMLIFNQEGVDEPTALQYYSLYSQIFPFNQWSSIKIQIDTNIGKVRFYVNGTLNSEQNCPIAPLLQQSVPLKLAGLGQSVPAYTLNGAIDEVRVSSENLLLKVAITGNGSGTVNSSPAGLACDSVLCSEYFTTGIPVTLMATPGLHSLFSGWSGSCSGSGDCSLLMDTSHTVGALFLTSMQVLVPGVPNNLFENLSKAYLSAPAGATLVVRDGTFPEDFVLDRPVKVTVNGGYDPTFGTVVGRSVVNGALAVQQGTLVARNLVVRAPTTPVSYSIPADGEGLVSLSSLIRIKKLEQLDPATVTSSTVSLWGQGRFGSFRIPISINYSSSLRLLSIHHTGLLPGATYSLSLSGLKNTSGALLPDSTLAFSTLKNQKSRSVYYKFDGTVQRYLQYQFDQDGWLTGSDEYVSPGTDGLWFTSDDIYGVRETLSYSDLPPRYIDHRYVGLGYDFDLHIPYQYTPEGSLARETFDLSKILGITVYTYNLQNLLDRTTNYLDMGIDLAWNTDDDVDGSYTARGYDQYGVKTREITYYRMISPEGVYLATHEIGGVVSYLYDTQGRLARAVSYESSGADMVWFNDDDVVTGYWDYTYAYGQLVRAVFRGAPGTDGIWLTADDTVLAYQTFTYDGAGNRKEVVRYAGSGPDQNWFTADDVRSVVDTFDARW